MSVIWVNPKMKFCPHYGKGCGFANEDEKEIEAHFLSVHQEEVFRAQGKLDGTKLTEEDKRLMIIAAIPDEDVLCPFCFTKWKSRATRFFNESDGKLSKMVRCKSDGGGCGRKMQAVTMTWYRNPREFGREVGAYKMFWKIVNEEAKGHDDWIKGLKTLYPTDHLKGLFMQLFWDGYGDSKPEFAEKQRIAKAAREYEAESKK